MRRRTLGLLLAAATVVAACSEPVEEGSADPSGGTQTEAPESGASSDDTPGEAQAPEEPSEDSAAGTEAPQEPSEDAAAGTEAPQEPSEDAPADEGGGLVPAGPDAPGVSDDTVTISIIITDTSMVAQAFGWEVPDEGDREAQVEALVDHFNAAGGFAGRQIEAKVTVFNAITDGPVAEEALCNKITQDDQAFAVVLTGQFQENARPCYRNADTLMFDATLYPVDNAGFEELAPYYWSPLLPSYDDLVGGLATALIEEGWFEGGTLGVIAIDSELSERVYAQQFLPRLEAAGVEVASYNTIDPTDSTSFNNDQLQAIINFREAGVDKVVAIGGSRLVSWFINTSITQNFAPEYALSSYDAPDFNAFNYPEMMPGASGISVLPGYDIDDDQLAFPASAAEQECADIFTAAGLEFTVRTNIRTGLLFCDVFRLLRDASPHLTELSAAGVTEAVWQLGDSFDAASVYGVEFTEGSYAGGDLYRRFRFDPGCECMVLTGDPADLDA
ncbi:MAG: ABC transporter substrate-binding protein [Acidimicrobiia bacterium]|nr:ABC transporter substrate-binding protein [Acidimicrobiia bacterium]